MVFVSIMEDQVEYEGDVSCGSKAGEGIPYQQKAGGCRCSVKKCEEQEGAGRYNDYHDHPLQNQSSSYDTGLVLQLSVQIWSPDLMIRTAILSCLPSFAWIQTSEEAGTCPHPPLRFTVKMNVRVV